MPNLNGIHCNAHAQDKVPSRLSCQSWPSCPVIELCSCTVELPEQHCQGPSRYQCLEVPLTASAAAFNNFITAGCM